MQTARVFSRVGLAAFFLAACGGAGGEMGAPLPPEGFGAEPSLGDGTPADGPDGDGAADVSNEEALPDPASGEAAVDDLELDPVMPPPESVGNGRIVGGTCTPVCASDATDPDATGATDGWGFENGESCLTPQSQLTLSSELCDIPELLPLPELQPEIPAGNVPRPEGNLSQGFFVSNGRLFDRFGADFVMRGINHPVVWFESQALAWMDEIATTGANSVRIVWETNRGSLQIARASIERAVELGMVPMIELHDITGSPDVNEPARMAQYYVDEMRDILLDFEPYLLVNIANEWGNFQTDDDTWVQAYRQAITVLRDAGINHTLVIDANDYGQRGSTIVSQGASLLDYDPQHNILFSTHMYQAYANPQTILDVIRGAQAASLPLIVGEFGYQHGPEPTPVPYEVMLDEAARVGMGYLAWSWTGNNQEVAYLDMSNDGTAANLSGWGDDIINGLNGIRSTSQPASLFTAP